MWRKTSTAPSKIVSRPSSRLVLVDIASAGLPKKEDEMTKTAKKTPAAAQPEPLGNKEYERELKKLHIELVKLQEWVIHAGLKVCVVFEGRDTAGKGGTIKAITERVSPRTFRVVALPAPTEREKSQMYVQRYIQHFPAAGEVVIFDRSWYNRAGVERVMGFTDEKLVKRFLEAVPKVESAMIESGIILIKYWLEVSPDEQTRRLKARIDDGRKTWKLTPMDVKSYARWFDYSRARDDMFKYTHTDWAPWIVANSDDKKRARLNIIRDLLSRIPYKALPRQKVRLPNRQKAGNYRDPQHEVARVKEHF
jgi:polyphosphate kinase 2